ALEMGLVNRVVPAKEVMNEALKFADSVLQGAPNAVLQTKRMIEELWSTSVKDDLERALKHHMQARGSTEGREGITAFNEKRKTHKNKSFLEYRIVFATIWRRAFPPPES